MTTPETTDLAGTAIDRLTPYLPGAAERMGGRSPAEALYDTIADRLRALGEETALAEFIQQPTNNSLIRRLLATATHQDPAFADELAAAVAATPTSARNGAPGTAHDQAGTHGDAVTPGYEADGSPEANRRPRRTGGVLIGIAALVAIVALVCLAGRAILGDLAGANGLTAQTSCEEFLRAPESEQGRAIQEIALAKGMASLDNRLALPAVAHFCTTQPAARIGDVVTRLGN